MKAPILWLQSDKVHAELCFLCQFVHLQSPCSDFATLKYHKMVLERRHQMQCIAKSLQYTLPEVSGEINSLDVPERIFFPLGDTQLKTSTKTCWRPCSDGASSTKLTAQIKRWSAAPNTDISVDSAVIFYTIQIDYEEERWQGTPLFNAHGERSWFNSADANTNVWAGIQLLDGQ